MSKIGKFQYKCRLCGEVYTEGETSAENAFIFLLSIISGTPSRPIVGLMPKMVDTHHCCIVGYGVADLQGVVYSEESEEVKPDGHQIPFPPLTRGIITGKCGRCGEGIGSIEGLNSHVCAKKSIAPGMDPRLEHIIKNDGTVM